MTQTQNQQKPQRSRQKIEAHLVAKAKLVTALMYGNFPLVFVIFA
jgi:hypothetical protein